MKIVPVEGTQRIFLGMQGEHLTRAITFDFTLWQNSYGLGSIQLQVRRYGETAPYLVPLQVKKNQAVWQVERRDTEKAGEGELQLVYIVNGEQVAKSRCFTTYVNTSLGQLMDVPPEEHSFFDKVTQDAGRAEIAAINAEKSAKQAGQDAAQAAEAQSICEAAKNQATAAVNVVTQEKATVEAAAEQTRQNTDTVSKAADMIAHQTEAVQKAVIDAGSAAERAEAGAKKVEEAVTQCEANMISQLCTPFDVTTNIVLCNPVAGRPLSVMSHITPLQQGGVVPDSQSVRQIKGWTGVKLVRCGKNLLNIGEGTKVINGVAFTVNGNGSVTVNAPQVHEKAVFYLRKNFYMPYKADMRLSKVAENDGYTTQYIGMAVAQPSGKTVYITSFRNPAVEDNATILNVYIDVEKDVPLETTFYPGLFMGKTAEETYQGNEYAVQFGKTIYGGTYDWASGQLTTSMKLAENLQWKRENTETPNVFRFSAVLNGAAVSDLSAGTLQAISDKFKLLDKGGTLSGKTIGFEVTGTENETKIFVVPTLASNFTVEQMNTLNAQFVYPLQNTETVRFAPEQILALPGMNAVYSDTGETTVKGYTDPIFEKQQLRDAIAALGAV